MDEAGEALASQFYLQTDLISLLILCSQAALLQQSQRSSARLGREIFRHPPAQWQHRVLGLWGQVPGLYETLGCWGVHWGR